MEIALDDAGGGNLVGELRRGCLVAKAVDDDAGARLGKARRDAAADVAARPRDEDGLAGEAQEVLDVGFLRHAMLRFANRAIVPL